MRWDLLMIFDDSSLPFIEKNGWWDGSTRDYSNGSFADLVDGVWGAVRALLPDRIEDVTLELIVSERFENRVCIRDQISTKSHAWALAFDTNLKGIQGASATAIRAKLASDPNAGTELERRWRDAAAEAITATEDVGLAMELLAAVRSLQLNR